jgi:EAL domain-containing protein (putative c-di-GMP-specific phosphodiesterase class I)
VMTAAPDVTTAAEAVRYGASDYIVKPFEPARLVKLVRRAVELGQAAKVKRESFRALAMGRPEAVDRAGLEVTLGRALDSLWMAYQPIVDARNRGLFGFEALLRSTEPALPNPGAVLEAAERLGRMSDVGRAVRTKVVEPFPAAPQNALFFVNLHTRDLADPTILDHAAPLTRVAHRVVLEITERASLDRVKDLRARIASLRELGFRIAVDDLGAGYAGLTSFALLEPEIVKLDMTLVRDVHQSATKRKLIRSMAELCRDMGMLVVGEGVETVEERDTLVELGCDLLQGYFFAKPGKPFPEVRF